MEVQQAMACPVCTLYLREGMSMQSHLNTHPKDQVIEALVRIYNPDRGPFPQPAASPVVNPFIQMVSEEQIIMGRQQVTSIFHPQVMSYPIYQQQHFLNANNDYLNSQNDSENIQPVLSNSENGSVAAIINVTDHETYENGVNELGTIISDGSNVIISSETEIDGNRPIHKTEVFIRDSAQPHSPSSSASNHSGITVRTDLTSADKTERVTEPICEQYITSDCDYQDEDARHSEDIINIEVQDPMDFCVEKEDENKEEDQDRASVRSCGGLDIQADERMPARGELSGQESLGNAISSDWLQGEQPLVTSSVWEEKDKKETQRQYQCLHCSKEFNCPKERRIHMATLHPTDSKKDIAREISCNKCDIQLTTLKELKIHTRTEHPRASRKCGVCDEIFATQETYVEHLIKVHPLECTTCGKTFHSKSGLSLHLKTHMAVKPHPCSFCRKTFVTAQKLREHMNSHTGFAPLQCNMCDRKFKRYSNLKQHKDVAHFKLKRKTKEYFCDCGEAFVSKKKLAWHKEIHLEKPRQCMYCSERYIHNASLTRHIRKTHDSHYLPPADETTSIKPKNVQCPICNLVFMESSLRAHMKQHSIAKQYGCIICGKKFHTKWNLHLHRWTHASRVSKPFKCNQCKGAFIRSSDFQAHIRSHYGHKPYTCNHCGMQFNRKQNWQRHEKEHSGEKKFICGECGKTFHRSYYLIEHARIHSGIKPYSCHICNKSSTTKSNHNKHLRTHHARETVNTEG